jgi:hypothetical protein
MKVSNVHSEQAQSTCPLICGSAAYSKIGGSKPRANSARLTQVEDFQPLSVKLGIFIGSPALPIWQRFTLFTFRPKRENARVGGKALIRNVP